MIWIWPFNVVPFVVCFQFLNGLMCVEESTYLESFEASLVRAEGGPH
jgi:hypothetical protein